MYAAYKDSKTRMDAGKASDDGKDEALVRFFGQATKATQERDNAKRAHAEVCKQMEELQQRLGIANYERDLAQSENYARKHGRITLDTVDEQAPVEPVKH
jgi:hypothetical protein